MADLEFRADTFFIHLQLSTLGNLHRLDRFVVGALGHILNLFDNIVTFKYLAKYHMLAIKPSTINCQQTISAIAKVGRQTR